MKKIYTTFLVVITIAISATAQTLAVKYDFTGNCADSSGSNNHGTANSITYTNDIANVANSAASFNGSSSYVTIPNFVGTNAGAPIHNVGISVWFKTNGKQKPAGIAYAGAQTIGNYPANFTPFLWIDSSGYLRSYFYAGQVYVLRSTDTVNDDKWHHAIFYYHKIPVSYEKQHLYIDGKEVDSYQGTVQGTPSYANIYLGACNPRNNAGMPDAWMYFNGTMDNFKAYITPNGPFIDSFLHCTDFLLTAHPQSQSKTIGSSVTLSVSHTKFLNDTVYTYQWKKNGVAVSGATSASFNIAALAASDTGSYVCEVKNNYNMTLVSNVGNLSIIPTGINGVAQKSGIYLFPNPATTVLNLSTDGKVLTSVTIYGLDGKVIKTVEQQGINSIDIASLSPGTYILKAVCGNEASTTRFTKE